MDSHAGRQRPFPAVVIVFALVLLCLFPGQYWIANLLPRISGLATIDSALTILDIPVHVPVTIDMILAPGLFIISYLVVILLYPSRRGMRVVMQRIGAVFAGVFALLLCTACGVLISYLVQGHLPKSISSGISSLGMNADIHLPYSGHRIIHLRGDVISLVCFIIGTAICIRQIKRAPRIRKVTRLTREQRMTPYERMLRERRELEKQGASRTANTRPGPTCHDDKSLSVLCRNHPLLTIEPEAVNYMPIE